MLVGWWLTFFVLIFASIIPFGLSHELMLTVWLVVPPLTAYFVYSD
jgi:hypothetical protein